MSDIHDINARAYRERQARKQAEKLLEEKSRELYYINQELNAIKDSLELTVAERTRELENKVTELTELKRALTKAKNQAEEASALKSRFVATVSHEIRTPLNGIMGSLELLKEEHLSDKAGSLVTMTTGSGTMLNALLNDILDFSKYEDQNFTLDQEVFSAQGFLNSIQSFWHTHCETKNVTLDINLHPDLPTYYLGDPGRLRQVLNNFISNALKYAQSPRLVIHFRPDTSADQPPTSDSHATQATELSVEDFGIGISEKEQEKLFKAFSQLNNHSSSDLGSGTGLGLAICKQLARVMAGNTGVTSVINKGSLFWLRIPLHVAEAPKKTKEKEISAQECFPQKYGYTPNILVVEDVLTNQILVKIMLESFGCTVATAANGAEALETTQKHAFDLILMDIGLPDSDGLTITQKIIRNHDNPNRKAPIIAFTAHGMTSDKKEYISAGMCDIISKPVQKQDLYQVIDHHLNKKVP